MTKKSCKMASGSSSLSNVADLTELMVNTRQGSNPVLPTSTFPPQHHHPFDPMKQSNAPGPTYPDAAIVIAVSPNTLLDGNRFICEVCYKGFPREQNLTLHRRVHNLPFHLKASRTKDVRKVYLCPEPTCINHNRSHALGDFGGLKKHYLRKHCTDKKYKCDKCSKTYAVPSDLKAHLQNCRTKKYNCECGARFSRHSRFVNHLGDCNAQKLEDAAKDTPNSDMRNNSVGSISKSNSTRGISSTTTYPPTSYMGENSSRSISNIKNNSLIGSTTSYIPTSDMGSNNNNLINSTMSTLPMFNMEHGSLQSIGNFNSHIGFTTPNPGPQISSIQNWTDQSQFSSIRTEHESLMTDPSLGINLKRIPPIVSPLSSIQQNQNEFQEIAGIGYYTNLMMNIGYNNVNPENTSYMGDRSIYGSGEGSNLFSAGSDMMFNNPGSLGLTSVVPNTTFGQELSAPEYFVNNNIFGSSSSTNITSSMPQGFTSSSYSQIGGFSMPQDYSGYVDGTGHVDYGAGREVFNSGTFGAATGGVAPYDEQYWNEHGFWL